MSIPAHTIAPAPQTQLDTLAKAMIDFVMANNYTNANSSAFVNASAAQITVTIGASRGPDSSYTITNVYPTGAAPAAAKA